MLAITIYRGQTCSCREVGKLPTSRIKGCVRWDEQGFNALPAKHRERRVNIVGAANLHRYEQNAARLGRDFGLTQLGHVQLVGYVHKQTQAGEARQHFTQEIDLLGGKHFCEVCRSEEHTSELQSLTNLVCRLLLE